MEASLDIICLFDDPLDCINSRIDEYCKVVDKCEYTLCNECVEIFVVTLILDKVTLMPVRKFSEGLCIVIKADTCYPVLGNAVKSCSPDPSSAVTEVVVTDFGKSIVCCLLDSACYIVGS